MNTESGNKQSCQSLLGDRGELFSGAENVAPRISLSEFNTAVLVVVIDLRSARLGVPGWALHTCLPALESLQHDVMTT